jgi:hypothetical protein
LKSSSSDLINPFIICFGMLICFYVFSFEPLTASLSQ